MKVYTRTGDDGSTGIYGGVRVSKADPRVGLYGTLDELNSVLGLAASLYPPPPPEVLQRLTLTQKQLHRVCAEIADPQGKSKTKLAPSAIKGLEQAIDSFEALLPNLKNFILPGGSSAGAALHLARTVCRRAEREMVAFNASQMPPQGQPLRPTLVIYLNRLSDLLFVMARFTNKELEVAEKSVK